MESSIYGRTTFKQLSYIDHISDTLQVGADSNHQEQMSLNSLPHTRVTSASDTNPLSLTSIASHILRLWSLASGVLAQGSLMLILSQLMMVTFVMM